MNDQQGLDTLSKRAAENVVGEDYWEPLVAAYANPWSKSNPNGMAVLGVAENALMHDELQAQLKKNFHIDPATHFSYGNGPRGSPRLRSALSAFFNSHFHPLTKTTPEEFLMTTGVTALIDHVSWCICADGEAILFPQPLYPGFTNDVPHRARGRLVPIPFEREDGTLTLDDVFDVKANTRAFERAYRKCEQDGVKVRGVMITNPHNPLGKCYPVKTIQAIAAFCARYDLHYLSDEIYAMSVFANPEYPNATGFTSVLSIELDHIIDPARVHVLYGMSKDFCSNGLRLGTMYSRNPALRTAAIGIAAFSWQAYMVQDMWAGILEDETFLDSFFAENQRRLGERYKLVTDILRANDIKFFGGVNAGFFVWIDLRDVMRTADDRTDATAMMQSSPRSSKYSAFEGSLGQSWWNKGVMINKGSGCLSEEYGWLRIIFTVEEECLMVGLQRFVEGLKEVRATEKDGDSIMLSKRAKR